MAAVPARPARAPRRAARPSMGRPYPGRRAEEPRPGPAGAEPGPVTYWDSHPPGARRPRRPPCRVPPRACEWRGARGSFKGGGGPSSAGERLGGVEVGDHLQVADDRGELDGGPRLAAVAAVLAVAHQAEQAPGLVLGDRQAADGGVAVAAAARGTQAQAPAGDHDGVPVVPRSEEHT